MNIAQPDTESTILLIPDFDSQTPEAYPGDIQPGNYDVNGLVGLLREHAHNPDAILFIADMLEE